MGQSSVKGGKFLKKLWCCAGREYNRVILYYLLVLKRCLFLIISCKLPFDLYLVIM